MCTEAITRDAKIRVTHERKSGAYERRMISVLQGQATYLTGDIKLCQNNFCFFECGIDVFVRLPESMGADLHCKITNMIVSAHTTSTI